jgi:hypothetical protein
VGKNNSDESIHSTADVAFPVTSNIDDIIKFLKNPNHKVIFSTYQSSPLIAEAQAVSQTADFDLVIALKCLEFIKSGGFFHPESLYGKICADIIGPSPNGYLMTGNGMVFPKNK